MAAFAIAVILLLSIPLQTFAADVPPVVVLELNQTIWRYDDAWRTEIARVDDPSHIQSPPGEPAPAKGDLIRIDAMNPWDITKRQVLGDDQFESTRKPLVRYAVRTTNKITGSQLAAKGWEQPGFDDGDWVRAAGPMQPVYRSLAIMYLRGKFQVNDPAAVSQLSLQLAFRGGVVAYLNGKEIGRAFMPKGDITADTPADDYPREYSIKPDGIHIADQVVPYESPDYRLPVDFIQKLFAGAPPSTDLNLLRTRQFTVAIPPGAIVKGTNVLSLEFHRAPAAEDMFSLWFEWGYGVACGRESWWWNRLGVEGLRLTAIAPKSAPDAIVPNVGSSGVHVWNQNLYTSVAAYGDANEAVSPLKIVGAKNGAYAAELAVSSPAPIQNLKVTASDLASDGHKPINSSAIEIRYLRGEAIENKVVETAKLQPIWITVHVPRDADAGDYAGKVTISADGLPPVDAAIQMHVSDFTVPDPQHFTTQMGIAESPETLALQYNVPLWSEEHWKLIDQAMAGLAELGNKRVFIPLVECPSLGHDHSMVYSTKHPDGTYKHDYSIADRYLALAVKHFGKDVIVSVLCMEQEQFLFTEKDATTGELKNVAAPKWGTKECVEFLKPLFAGLDEVVKKNGVDEDHIFIGFTPSFYGAGWASDQSEADLAAAMPAKAKWFGVGHYLIWAPKVVNGDLDFAHGPDGHAWGYVCVKSGAIGVFWEPDVDPPIYGWTYPNMLLGFPFCYNKIDNAGCPLYQRYSLPTFRLAAEGILLTGHPKSQGGNRGNPNYPMRGFDNMGGDYWQVLKGAHGDQALGTLTHYSNFYMPVQYFLAPGKDGPVATPKGQMLREGLQEAEARIFVQNALLDPASKAKLGAELAARAKTLCDERTRALHYVSEFCFSFGVPFNSSEWSERSRDLYDTAADVAHALAK